MALSGLRPLKETNTQSVAADHYTNMSGAYSIYVQDNFVSVDSGQDYYAAKWLRLAAGDYTIRFVGDDVADFKLNGEQVAAGTNGGSWTTPLTVTFRVAADDVYRWDLHYRNNPANSAAYIAYELRKGDTLIEVSRAQDFIGDTIPIPDSALGPKPPYNTDIRLSYPVFIPKPDWQYGVTERLEWLTDVLTSESGAEQRRKLRQTPRRSLEATFTRFGNHRNLVDSYLSGVGRGNGLVPLWWDETKIEGVAFAGNVDLFGDFRHREFFANNVVMIRREEETDYELNIVVERTDNKLVLLYGLQNDTKGGTVTPVRVAQIREDMSASQKTDKVRQYQLRFFTVEAAEYTTDWTFPFYGRTNLPIMLWEPNYREQMDLSFMRQAYTLDNQVGNVYTADPGGTASINEKLGFMLVGRDAMHDFKTNIYKMAGRWRELHVPSGHNEFELSRDVNSGALVVYRSGYSQYRLSQQATRMDVLIELYDGQQLPNTIISSRVVGNEEWLFLSETVPPVPKEQVRRISYMPRSRLDIDAVEITRLTDADGVSQVALTFKAIVERRNAPPIPIQ